MDNFKPSPSTVASVGIGAPLAAIISWLLGVCCSIPVPPGVEAAMGAVMSAVVGYFFMGGRSNDLGS